MFKFIGIINAIQAVSTIANVGVTNFKENTELKANSLQNSELITKIITKVKKFFNETNTKFEKRVILDDLKRENLLLLFENSYAVVNVGQNKILELGLTYFDKLSLSFGYSYIVGDGIKFEKFIKKGKYKQKESYNGYKNINKEVEKKLDFLSKVEKVIPNAWWWASRRDENQVGYFDLNRRADYKETNNAGLCEYIAMANILLYNELFTSSEIFNDEEMNKYLKTTTENFDGDCLSFPSHQKLETHSNYSKSWDYKDKSLVYKLWNYTRWINLKSEWGYKETINSFLKNKPSIHDYKHEWEVTQYYWRGRENINNGMPYILSSAKTSHAFVVYGYDDDMVLVNWLWGDQQSMKLLSDFDVSGIGTVLLRFWYGLAPKNGYKQPLKKHFEYNGKKYTGNEITNMMRRKYNY